MYCQSADSLELIAVSIVLVTGLLYRWRKELLLSLSSSSVLYQNLFLASTLFLAGLWAMGIETDFGLSLHFLGMAVVVLLIGRDLAILSGLLALLIQLLHQQQTLTSLALASITGVVLPVIVMSVLVRWEALKSSSNFFVYIMVNGFFGAMLTVTLSTTAALVACYGLGQQAWSSDHQLILSYLPLIALPEGILNGMLLTGLLVFQPHWVRTLNERRYEQ